MTPFSVEDKENGVPSVPINRLNISNLSTMSMSKSNSVKPRMFGASLCSLQTKLLKAKEEDTENTENSTKIEEESKSIESDVEMDQKSDSESDDDQLENVENI